EQAPEAAPERAPRAPEFDSITSAVEADDLFFGMVSFADDADIFHLEAGSGQLFHCGFRSLVIREDRDDRVSCFHLILFQDGVTPGHGFCIARVRVQHEPWISALRARRPAGTRIYGRDPAKVGSETTQHCSLGVSTYPQKHCILGRRPGAIAGATTNTNDVNLGKPVWEK